MYIYCICLCKIIISKEKVKNLRGGRAWEELDGVEGVRNDVNTLLVYKILKTILTELL